MLTAVVVTIEQPARQESARRRTAAGRREPHGHRRRSGCSRRAGRRERIGGMKAEGGQRVGRDRRLEIDRGLRALAGGDPRRFRRGSCRARREQDDSEPSRGHGPHECGSMERRPAGCQGGRSLGSKDRGPGGSVRHVGRSAAGLGALAGSEGAFPAAVPARSARGHRRAPPPSVDQKCPGDPADGARAGHAERRHRLQVRRRARRISLCASAGYVLNDILDIEADRAHPTKRTRPFASGELPVGRWGRRCSPCCS